MLTEKKNPSGYIGEAILDAAQIAGLNILRVMNEHTATALAYGIYRSNDFDPEKPMNVALLGKKKVAKDQIREKNMRKKMSFERYTSNSKTELDVNLDAEREIFHGSTYPCDWFGGFNLDGIHHWKEATGGNIGIKSTVLSQNCGLCNDQCERTLGGFQYWWLKLICYDAVWWQQDGAN